MAYIVVPTITRLSEKFDRPELETSFRPQTADFCIKGEPTEVIKNHPEVLSFYNGKTDQLAIADLESFCRELAGYTSLTPDRNRIFHVGPHVLTSIPPEPAEQSVLKRAFAYIRGEDTTQYFSQEDHMTVNDFLDSVLIATDREFVITQESPLMIERHPEP